jgi:hypothetical protein
MMNVMIVNVIYDGHHVPIPAPSETMKTILSNTTGEGLDLGLKNYLNAACSFTRGMFHFWGLKQRRRPGGLPGTRPARR